MSKADAQSDAVQCERSFGLIGTDHFWAGMDTEVQIQSPLPTSTSVYQVLLQSYSDSHHSNAIRSITSFGKYGRKDPQQLSEGERCGSAGLSTGNFKSWVGFKQIWC